MAKRPGDVSYNGWCVYQFEDYYTEPNSACQECGFHKWGVCAEKFLPYNTKTNNRGSAPQCLVHAFMARYSLKCGDKFLIKNLDNGIILGGVSGSNTSPQWYYFDKDCKLHHTANVHGGESSSVMWKLLAGQYALISREAPTAVIQTCIRHTEELLPWEETGKGWTRQTANQILCLVNYSFLGRKPKSITIFPGTHLYCRNESCSLTQDNFDTYLYILRGERYSCVVANPSAITECNTGTPRKQEDSLMQKQTVEVNVTINTRFDNKELWITRGRSTVRFKDMTTAHLLNTLRMFILYPERTEDMLIRDIEAVNSASLIPREWQGIVKQHTCDDQLRILLNQITTWNRKTYVLFALRSEVASKMRNELYNRGINVAASINNFFDEVPALRGMTYAKNVSRTKNPEFRTDFFSTWNVITISAPMPLSITVAYDPLKVSLPEENATVVGRNVVGESFSFDTPPSIGMRRLLSCNYDCSCDRSCSDCPRF